MSTVGLLLVVVTALMTMGANLMLRSGIVAAGGFEASGLLVFVEGLVRLFLQPLFAAGFITYFLASVVWFRIIATEPLSVAYPVLVSLTFTSVTAGAVLMFGEPLSLRKVLGIATILVGIVIVSMEKST